MSSVWSITRGRAAGALMLVCLPIAGCSSSAGPFPAVLGEPAPRPDTPLSPDQVKQAVDNLLSDRTRLCTEAVASSAGTPGASATAANCGPDGAATGTAGVPGKP